MENKTCPRAYFERVIPMYVTLYLQHAASYRVNMDTCMHGFFLQFELRVYFGT